MKEFFGELFKFLERNLPGWLAAYFVGRNQGEKIAEAKEKELALVKLELEKKKNAEIIEKLNKNLDSPSIIRRAIERGRKILNGDR